jgi:flagellar biosynthesis protein FlhA
VATNEDIGTQLTGQLFTNPRVLIITGCILVLMGLIPGMPHFAFLLLGGGLIQLGRMMKKRATEAKSTAALATVAPAALTPTENTEASWDDVTMIDTLGLEVGFRSSTKIRTANCSSGSRASARSLRRKSASCRR